MQSKTATKSQKDTDAGGELMRKLVMRIIAGDDEAFGAVFKNYKVVVSSVCLRMTRNEADAEDLTQEVFLKVLKRIQTLRNPSAFLAWLREIALRESLQYLRRRHRERCLKSLEDLTATKRPDGESGQIKLESRIGAEDLELESIIRCVSLEKALEEMPLGRLKFLYAFYDLGMSHKEIAEVFGCSVGNSKRRLHDAKIWLKKRCAEKSGRK